MKEEVIHGKRAVLAWPPHAQKLPYMQGGLFNKNWRASSGGIINSVLSKYEGPDPRILNC